MTIPLEGQFSPSSMSTSVSSSFSLADYSNGGGGGHEEQEHQVDINANSNNNKNSSVLLRPARDFEELFNVFDQEVLLASTDYNMEEVVEQEQANYAESNNEEPMAKENLDNHLHHPHHFNEATGKSFYIVRKSDDDDHHHHSKCSHNFVGFNQRGFLGLKKTIVKPCIYCKRYRTLSKSPLPSMKCKYCKVMCHQACQENFILAQAHVVVEETLPGSFEEEKEENVITIVQRRISQSNQMHHHHPHHHHHHHHHPHQLDERGGGGEEAPLVRKGKRTLSSLKGLGKSLFRKSHVGRIAPEIKEASGDGRLSSLTRGEDSKSVASDMESSIASLDSAAAAADDSEIIRVVKPAVLASQKIYQNEDGSLRVFPETLHLSLSPIKYRGPKSSVHNSSNSRSFSTASSCTGILRSGRIADLTNIRSQNNLPSERNLLFPTQSKKEDGIIIPDTPIPDTLIPDTPIYDLDDNDKQDNPAFEEDDFWSAADDHQRNNNNSATTSYESCLIKEEDDDKLLIQLPARRCSFHGPFPEQQKKRPIPSEISSSLCDCATSGNNNNEKTIKVLERILDFYHILDERSHVIKRVECCQLVQDLFHDIRSMILESLKGDVSINNKININPLGLSIMERCQEWLVRISRCSDYSHSKESSSFSSSSSSFSSVDDKEETVMPYSPIECRVPLFKNVLLTLLLAIKLEILPSLSLEH